MTSIDPIICILLWTDGAYAYQKVNYWSISKSSISLFSIFIFLGKRKKHSPMILHHNFSSPNNWYIASPCVKIQRFLDSRSLPKGVFFAASSPVPHLPPCTAPGLPPCPAHGAWPWWSCACHRSCSSVCETNIFEPN